MTIMAILAGMLLGALFQASERAKEISTQATINKLNSQLMLRWESYRTRRLVIDPRQVLVTALADYGIAAPSTTNTKHLSLVRLRALRELMRMEIPDRYKDLHDAAWQPKALVVGGTPVRPALWYAYRQRIAQAQGLVSPTNAQIDNVLQGGTTPDIAATNQTAECLYLVVTMGTEDDSLRGDQTAPDVGDTDNDGMFEFLDAWGRPIEFFRWAPGFVSDMQPRFPDLTLDRDPFNHHDPFDVGYVDQHLVLSTSNAISVWNPIPAATPPYNAVCNQSSKNYYRGYALTPLIVSRGVDNDFGLFFGLSSGLVNPASNADILLAEFDPYALYDDSSGTFYQRAEPLANNASFDNIHNHVLGSR